MFELSEVAKPGIREAMVGHFRHIDEGLTHRIATGLALARMPVAPSTAARVLQLDPSLALQPRVSTGINLHVGVQPETGDEPFGIGEMLQAIRA